MSAKLVLFPNGSLARVYDIPHDGIIVEEPEVYEPDQHVVDQTAAMTGKALPPEPPKKPKYDI